MKKGRGGGGGGGHLTCEFPYLNFGLFYREPLITFHIKH